jgi:hypothetical protein
MAKLFDVEGSKDTKYSRAVRTPQYQIKGDCPQVVELFDNAKTNTFLNHIRNANISDEEKDFLRLAAYRHVKFRYDRIAEYYAHASKEMQELMEESALVIIDIDDAIANGYVKLSEKLKDIVEDAKKKEN